MSIIQNLAKTNSIAKEQYSRAKETSCHIDLTISDSDSIPEPSIIHE